jgi:tripartite ATP-independent transporter DctM subunit
MIDVLWIFALLIVLVFLGLPIFVSFIITSLAAVLVLGIPLSVIAVKTFGGIDSFSLMAIPFFILAGNIMMESEITEKIVNFANSLVGRLKGGLGHVSIVSSMIFAGIQGSGVADASAIGSIMIPSMVKQGYGKDYAVAIIASAATIGPIIPPSIAMIMYAYYTELSVGKLFLGGFVPGVLIGIGLMIVNAILFRSRKYDFELPRRTFKEFLVTTYHSIGALIMPMIIVFGIVGGVFTPTESGIAAAVYGLFYGLLISKKLTLKKLGRAIVDAANTTASVMIILAVAGVFSNILTRLRFQDFVINNIVLGIADPYLATLTIMLIIIVLGCFIDPSVLIVMFGSTVHAAGVTLGFDPIHYGVLMVVTMLIGAITPPVGSMLFIACSIAGIPMEESLKPLLPCILILFIVCIAILFVPGLVTLMASIV